MTFLYGLLLLLLLYGVAAMFYFVYYTPGTYTLYDSPVSRILFPWAKHPLFPTWGTSKSGMLKLDSTKYGQGDFWPTTQKYEPNESRGADPMGGMRPTDLPKEPVELRDGYDPLPSLTDNHYLYEQSAGIPGKTISPIGWWGNELF
uniref:Uncharacterized protein n=1 Tax=viral metagenome TaxID=1070528 RepID=A0A6C0IGR1_9ZZZZ